MIFGKAFEKIKQGLAKTRESFGKAIHAVLTIGRKLSIEDIDRIEELLLAADIGVEATTHLIEGLKRDYKDKKIEKPDQVLDYLKAELKRRLGSAPGGIVLAPAPPTVVMIAGVNGTGKTTSIAKLTRHFATQNRKVLLAASDTFRAAAIEQLTAWSERLGVEIVHHRAGADPSAVAFDAVEAAVSRKVDLLFVDTAGRLHTKVNLMKELTKIRTVIGKKLPGAPHETLLVLDATVGQNAIAQAKAFHEASPLTGIVLAKMDGTAKGGIVVAIHQTLGLPVKYLGVGEKPDDLEVFDPEAFVEALFAE